MEPSIINDAPAIQPAYPPYVPPNASSSNTWMVVGIVATIVASIVLAIWFFARKPNHIQAPALAPSSAPSTKNPTPNSSSPSLEFSNCRAKISDDEMKAISRDAIRQNPDLKNRDVAIDSFKLVPSTRQEPGGGVAQVTYRTWKFDQEANSTTGLSMFVSYFDAACRVYEVDALSLDGSNWNLNYKSKTMGLRFQ
jgi:hypothetical protein